MGLDEGWMVEELWNLWWGVGTQGGEEVLKD